MRFLIIIVLLVCCGCSPIEETDILQFPNSIMEVVRIETIIYPMGMYQKIKGTRIYFKKSNECLYYMDFPTNYLENWERLCD